jgi:SAM-dependent methyltransferase
MGRVSSALGRLLPRSARRALRRRLRDRRKARSIRTPDLGDLRRTEPISRTWGADRGRPVDRYYIDSFLEAHRADIRGHTLEIGNSLYTERFGSGVTESDVLHVEEGSPNATIVGDLATGEGCPSDTFDCILLTQTLHEIYDVAGALRTVGRMLRPGGVLLATVPGISGIIHPDAERWGDYWRFTTYSLERLFADAGLPAEIRSRGNVLASSAFLFGLASRELTAEELETDDPDYQLLLTIRTVKPRP